MTRGGIKEYLDAIRKRYTNASREGKGRNPHTIAGRKPGCSWGALDSGLLGSTDAVWGVGKGTFPGGPFQPGRYCPAWGPE